MPKQEQLDRGRDIRRYFAAHYAGKVQDIEEARSDLQERFSINTNRWKAYWKAELERLNQLHAVRREQEPSPVVPEPPQPDRPENGILTLHVPEGMPEEAKQLVNQLLARNEAMAEDLEVHKTLIKIANEQSVQYRKKNDFLKRLSKELIDQL